MVAEDAFKGVMRNLVEPKVWKMSYFTKTTRHIIRAIIYTFSMIGIMDLIGRGLVLPISGTFYGYMIMLPHDYNVEEVVTDGGEGYKAIVYMWSGPAFDAGCEKMVAVVNAVAPIQTSWGHKDLVYQAGCDRLLHVAWEPPADGRVTPRLRIDAEAGAGSFMTRRAMGGRVAVAYRGDR